jgi:hypothetical protein
MSDKMPWEQFFATFSEFSQSFTAAGNALDMRREASEKEAKRKQLQEELRAKVGPAAANQQAARLASDLVAAMVREGALESVGEGARLAQ